MRSHGVSTASCSSKDDLQELLENFEMLRMKPLDYLQMSCQHSNKAWASDADACAASLLNPAQETASSSASNIVRTLDSNDECLRVANITQQDGYPSHQSWAFALLGLHSCSDLAAAKRSYKELVLALHPDKCSDPKMVPDFNYAFNWVQWAMEVCQRHFDTPPDF